MSLAALPVELLHATFVHLAPKDLAAIATTSRALKAAAYDERLWAAAVLGQPPWQVCGAAVGSAVRAGTHGFVAVDPPLMRLRFARARTRCAQCLQRTLPVQQQSHSRLEELRRAAQLALSLSREQFAYIQASLSWSCLLRGAAVAVWPNRHGTRVWMGDLDCLSPDRDPAKELKLLCSRDAVEGWMPLDTTRLRDNRTCRFAGGGEAVMRWEWDTADGGLEWAEVERFLVEAVKASDLARYLPPLRASTFAARLQLEMRAKEIALERILLDGDCVFGFSVGYDVKLGMTVYTSHDPNGFPPGPPPPTHFCGVVACQRSSDRERRLASGEECLGGFYYQR